MFRLLLSFVFVIALSATSFAQKVQFKTYKDTAHGFSLDLPKYWTIHYSKEQEGVICTPTTKAQKEEFKNCFEGIVFRMEFLNYGLDSLLRSQYAKHGGKYVTTDKVGSNVPVKFIKGKHWTGIRHDNTCGINCNDDGFHAGAGECQFLYFSNGKRTIGINTNGRAFDETVLSRIISSFKFLNPLPQSLTKS